MTLKQNMISSGPVYLHVEGDVSMFEGYEPPTLVLVSNSDSAEFAAICKSIPYEGLRAIHPQGYPAVLAAPSDETALEILSFLSALPSFDRNVASPAELDQQMLTISCILATNYYFNIPREGFLVQYYRKELQPIADAIEAKLGGQEDMFWIAEHVQKTAKLLYGDDFNLQLTEESCQPWHYFAAEGVITPSHRGCGDSLLPVILSYEAIAGGYRVEAVYIYKDMEGYDIGDSVEIPEQSLADTVYQKAPRREILLKRAKDGKLRFVSHRFL